MRQAAESHSEEDRRKFEEVEARNQLDNAIYAAEKMVRENREKLGEANVKPVEDAVAEAKKALNEGDTARLRSARESLERSLHKVAEELYRSTAAAGAPGQTGAGTGASGSAAGEKPSGGKGQGDVIDAEYVDVDETKKPN
jgi:molecular chaperone DnaK